MLKLLRRLAWPVAAALLLLLAAGAAALTVPPVPTDIPIVDQTNTLTADQKSQLAQMIAAERQHSGNQIGVLMIPSLDGQPIEDYSLSVARTWGIGDKSRDNGVLLLIAKNDHQMRIEVGYGLEGSLTDLRSGRIIRDRIAPLFRQGKYFEGIQSGLQGIIAEIHNETDPALSDKPNTTADLGGFAYLAAFGIIGFSWIAAMLARTKSWWAGGVLGGIGGMVCDMTFIHNIFLQVGSVVMLAGLGLLLDKVVSANYRQRVSSGLRPNWWAGGGYIGGGGRSSSGGGFGGFGGGGFGGGGASGGW